jgi:hypothetical protein
MGEVPAHWPCYPDLYSETAKSNSPLKLLVKPRIAWLEIQPHSPNPMTDATHQSCRALTDTIEFELIQAMLGEQGGKNWTVEEVSDVPWAQGSKQWLLTSEPEKGKLLAAQVKVGPQGVSPEKNPRPREVKGRTAEWMGREKLWEGQPEETFRQTVSGRAQEELKEGRRRLSQLSSDLQESNFGSVSPKPGSARTQVRRRIFPIANDDDRSLAAGFFEGLRANFRGFDGPKPGSVEARHGEKQESSPLEVHTVFLPFYSEGPHGISASYLVELTTRRRGRPRRARFVWCTDYKEGQAEPARTLHLEQLDGTSNTIGRLNEFLDVRLRFEHAAQYLHFASSSLHGKAKRSVEGAEYPAFTIVEDVGEIDWYPETEEVKRIVAEHMAPISVQSSAEPDDPSKPFVAGAFVFYSGELSFAVFNIMRQPTKKLPFLLTMEAEFPLFSNLPARPVVDSAGNCFLLQPRSKLAL